jgi:uncharacterized protein (TIGR04255 family)
MARQRHLSHAPITEALIDIHVVPRHGLTFAGLKEAIGTPDFGYYLKNPISEGFFGFKLTSDGQQPETTAESALVGLRLHSLDEKYVAQCRLSGFTLSRLPPYEEWSRLVEETRRVWAVYTERLAPVRVTRVATRFINNLQFPLQQGGSYQTYLHKLVDVPDEAPQAVASFFQRFQLVEVESTARVNLTLALETTPPTGPAPVILDVDAFMFTDLVPTDGRLWEILERLRELKNRTFFSSLTEAAAELYE